MLQSAGVLSGLMALLLINSVASFALCPLAHFRAYRSHFDRIELPRGRLAPSGLRSMQMIEEQTPGSALSISLQSLESVNNNFIPSSKLSVDAMRTAANSDRRTVLRKGTFGVASAIIAAAGSSAVAEAKPPSSGRTMNFPRVHPGLTVGNPTQGQVCEIFVDFCCPYSRKIFLTVSSLSDKYTDRMAFVYHHVLQPWHHQSLWLHESSFAVKVLYPKAEVAYWSALFDDAPQWYDKEIYGLTRGGFYDRVASFAANVVAAEAKKEGDALDVKGVKGRLLQYLIPPLQPGGKFPEEARALLGSGPGDDENALFPLTRQLVKFQRKRGVHVTPTCFFNGIEQDQISSSWTPEQWVDFLGQALD